MSRLFRKIFAPCTLAAAFTIAISMSVASPANAAGLLSPKDGSTPPLELMDQMVQVVIEDGYAITEIDQVFRNPHSSDFEALYSFPVPDKAAVSEFTYWIDGKPISGEVLEKKQARDIYEKEKAQGREAAITEQDDYRTFDITVWPVRAGQDVRVRLSYIQPAHVDTGIGRYVYPLEDGGVDEQKASFWNTGDVIKGRFSFDLEIRPAYPIQTVRLPAHPGAEIKQDADGNWHVHISKAGQPQTATISANGDDVIVITEGPNAEFASSSEVKTMALKPPAQAQLAGQNFRLDTDILVYWKQQDGLPASVDLVAHREAGEERGTFMMVLTPGDDLKPITEGRDWVFVLDISGSMDSKFATLAQGVAKGLRTLTPADRFRIVYFNNKISGDANFVSATPENIDRAIMQLDTVNPAFGTNLFGGLAHGLNNLDADRTAGVILVTDGVANLGETYKRAFIDLVEKQDVRLFTLVMGNSANRPLLKAISLASGGTAINVSNSDDVIGAVVSATSKLTHEALHDVQVSVDGVKVSDLSPKRIMSLYRGQQLVMFGHYWGEGDAEVTLNAKVSGQPVSFKTNFAFPATSTRNPEIERLWAFATIEDQMRELTLFGENADTKQAVVDLAIESSLVTPFTSMVVVREPVFANYGIERKNRDRLVKEATARQQRATQPAQPRQVASVSPSPRASYNGDPGAGGGSTDLWILVLIGLMLAPMATRKSQPNKRAA